VSIPVAGKKAGKRNKKGKQNVIWDLLEKLGVCDIDELSFIFSITFISLARL
jgi:hypothetical protein